MNATVGWRNPARVVARRLAMTMLATTLVLAGSAHAGALPVLDLGGAWTGTIKCKTNFNGAKGTDFFDPTLRITQIGTALGVKLDYGDPFPELYVALASPDAKKPEKKGELMLNYCGTDDVLGSMVDYDELGRFSFSGKPGQVKATLKGTTVYVFQDFAPSGGGICKWKYTRTDVGPQNTQVGCTQNMLQLSPTQ